MNNIVSIYSKTGKHAAKSPLIPTVQEVADLIGVSASSVYSLVRCEVLPCIRVGRSIRIRRCDLCEFLGLDEI